MNLKKLVEAKNNDLKESNSLYSLEVYEYSNTMEGLKLMYKGSQLMNLVVFDDSEYIAEIFILNLDQYMVFKEIDKK